VLVALGATPEPPIILSAAESGFEMSEIHDKVHTGFAVLAGHLTDFPMPAWTDAELDTLGRTLAEAVGQAHAMVPTESHRDHPHE
jgi:hypothetical protein